MKHALDAVVAPGRTLADVVFEPLDARGLAPIIVDVGARNGMILPTAYAKRANLVGFEPNAKEYEKLLTHTTDAEAAGLSTARFKNEEYHNCALWNEESPRTFYITAGTGACTLLGETDPKITRRMYLEGNKQPYEDLHTKVLEEVPVQCKTLDGVLGQERKIDILKLDVEGGEFKVLQGSRKNLEARNLLLIKTEFVFFPYYKQIHPVLGHLHVFLNDQGFRLLDLDFNQAKYTRGVTRIPAAGDRRLIYAGDAYFVLDPDRVSLSRIDLHRTATAALVYGFHSLSVSLLRDAGLLSSSQLDAIESCVSRISLRRRLRHAWMQFPYRVASVFGLLR